jgi:hypothetical protein
MPYGEGKAMRFTIHFDLLAPETSNDYKKLSKALSDMGAKKILYSGWGVRREGTAANLRDHLWQFMDGNDRIIVQAVESDDFASMNQINKLSEM